MDSSNIFRFLKPYLKNDITYILVALGAMLFWAIEISLSPFLLKTIIDRVSENFGHTQIVGAILFPVCAYVLLSLILNINFRIYDYVALKFYPNLRSNITRNVYSKLTGYELSFFQNSSPSSLTKRVFDLSNSVEQMLIIGLEAFLPIFLSMIAGTAILFYSVHYIFSITLIAWTIFFVVLSYIVSIGQEKCSAELSQKLANLSGRVGDIIANIITIKSFSAQRNESEAVEDGINNIRTTDTKLHWHSLKANFIQSLGMSVLVGSMMALLVSKRVEGVVSVGDFALVLTLSISILNSIRSIGPQMLQFSKHLGVCNNALSLLELNKQPKKEATKALSVKINYGKIEFRNLSFGYSLEEGLFKDVSFTINPGEKVGIMGPSGAGKSSLFKLLLKLCSPISGSIHIDGYDIQSITTDSLLESISVVPQETTLLNRSISENISLSKPDASIDEIKEAARLADCYDFINELPLGFDTIVGEQGLKLSGGQRQRISIARAILKNAPIMLIDEATSSLDNQAENRVMQALDRLMCDKTCLIVSHNQDLLAGVDRLFLLDENGRIKEIEKSERMLA